MEKRLVAFVVISVVIIFLYPVFISWVTGKTQNTPLNPSSEIGEVPREDDQGDISQNKMPSTSAGSSEPLSRPGSSSEIDPSEKTDERPIVDEIGAVEIEKVIESDLYRITLSSIGGTIKKWELKKYTEKNEEGDAEVGIQLVPEEMKHFPLTLILPGEPTGKKRNYQFDAATLNVTSDSPDGLVKMVYISPGGKKIFKEFGFHHDTYLIDFKIQTEGFDQAYDLTLGTNFGIHEWGLQRGGTVGAIGLIDNKVVRANPKKMKEDKNVFNGTAKWFGLQDKYFLSALIPKDPLSVGSVSFEKQAEEEISAKIHLIKEEGAVGHAFSLYVGPKEFDRLNAVNANLDETIDFGWFIFGSLLPVRMIAKPIFYLLRFFHSFTHNYGVAIIIVTVLIKALFFPITQKSMKSMKSMSTIQPKINALRKQWGKDKEKMNQELMKLYKVEKVNPLGGCLPMVIQIPVFISLYNILYTTIELRHAPFFLWVQDLSTKDPYYVLPVIMGATMFLQQYTAPKTMEGSQNKIMQFLPIVYTFFFLNFPSGLVLYWLVNNSLTIVQQFLLNKQVAA